MKASEIQMDESLPHGTKEGYALGCQGSHCPGTDRVGMSCKQANARFASDLSYRRRINAGMSPEAIHADDQLEAEIAAGVPKAASTTVSDRYGNSFSTVTTVTVADSAEPIVADDFDDVDSDIDETVPAVPKKRGRKPVPIAHGTDKGWKKGCREDCPGDTDGLTCEAAHTATLKRGRVSAFVAEQPSPEATADVVAEQVASADAVVSTSETSAEEAVGKMVVPDRYVASTEPTRFTVPAPHAEGTAPVVRAEGLLADLADARADIDTLNVENDRLAKEVTTLTHEVSALRIEQDVRGAKLVAAEQRAIDLDTALDAMTKKYTEVETRLTVELSRQRDNSLVELATSPGRLQSLHALPVSEQLSLQFTFADGRLAGLAVNTGS